MNAPERIFEHYKHRLEYDEVNKESKKSVRFCTIQYLCSFPKIDPVEMAASIMMDGLKIEYDSYAVSDLKNKQYEKIVLKKYYNIRGGIDNI